MNLEHANAALFAALSAAQGEIENATKGSVNPHFKSRYADLAEVLNTIRPVFAKHGLGLMQSTAFDGAMVTVTTAVIHKEGGFVTSQASCTPAKTDAQGIGGSTTYLRRYSAAAMAAISQEDDDGNAAAHNKPAAKPNTPPPPNSEELNSLLIAIGMCDNLEDLRRMYEDAGRLNEYEAGIARNAARQRKAKLEASK